MINRSKYPAGESRSANHVHQPGLVYRQDAEDFRHPARDAVTLTEALDRLIQLYTETNKPDEVKKWQAERDRISKTVEKK